MQIRLVVLYLLLICISVSLRYHYNNNYYTQPVEPSRANKTKALAKVKYKDRRALIKRYCEKHKSDFRLRFVNDPNDPKWKKGLFYDYEHQLLFCGISKVSSTTWVTNLMQ